MLSVLDIIEDTMVDGPGFRTSIYCAGCHHACPGCQNPQSWDINNGRLMSTREIMDIIKSDPWANVTFSGGDPMYQAEGFTELARAIRQETFGASRAIPTSKSYTTLPDWHYSNSSTYSSTDRSSRHFVTPTSSFEVAPTSDSSTFRHR